MFLFCFVFSGEGGRKVTSSAPGLRAHPSWAGLDNSHLSVLGVSVITPGVCVWGNHVAQEQDVRNQRIFCGCPHHLPNSNGLWTSKSRERTGCDQPHQGHSCLPTERGNSFLIYLTFSPICPANRLPPPIHPALAKPGPWDRYGQSPFIQLCHLLTVPPLPGHWAPHCVGLGQMGTGAVSAAKGKGAWDCLGRKKCRGGVGQEKAQG